MAQYALVPGHFQAVQLVEDAKTIQDQEALIHRALRWGDKALARALVMKHGGVPERRSMHEVLAGVDPRVKASFDFERKHGAYVKKSASAGTWAGWQTPYFSGSRGLLFVCHGDLLA